MTWDQRIDQAKQTGEFTKDDIDASSNWTTCSLGERLKILHDDKLTELLLSKYLQINEIRMNAVKFQDQIISNNPGSAKTIHDEIKLLEKIK